MVNTNHHVHSSIALTILALVAWVLMQFVTLNGGVQLLVQRAGVELGR